MSEAEPWVRFQWGAPRGGVRYSTTAWHPDMPEQVFHALVAASEAVEPYDVVKKAPQLLEALLRLPVDARAPARQRQRDRKKLEAFASEYGLLGVWRYGYAAPLKPGDPPIVSTPVERLEDWRRELRELAGAAELLRAISEEDQKALTERLAPGGAIVYQAPNFAAGYVKLPSGLVEIARSGEPLLKAKLALQAVLNRKCREHPARHAIAFDPKTQRFEQHATYTSLLGVAWDQLAQAFTEGRAVRRCPRCGHPFRVNPKSRRGHERHCSTACRMAMYRRRKEAPARHRGGPTSGRKSRRK